MKKIVIADYEFPNLDPENDAFKGLEDFEIVAYDHVAATEEELIERVKDADAVLNQWNHITPAVIEAMDHCKVISTYGIGVDKIDVETASKKGIYVTNSPDYNKFEVANHACALILALSRQLIDSDKKTREGKYGWMYFDKPLHRMDDQILGFVGFGRIAKQISHKMSVFGFKTIAYDPFLTAEQIEAAGGKKVELEEVMSQSDFVSINVSLTKDTYHMIGKEYFDMMKPTAYLVNCARGAVCDEMAMYEALKEGKFMGAGLDTFEDEPILPDHPLMSLDNIIFTPHSAWHNRESMWDMQWGTADQVAKVLKGEVPDHCVNTEAVLKVLGK